MLQPASRRLTIAIALLFAVVLGGTSWAQTRSFGEQTDVVVVEVPAYVTRNGEPVRGLAKENFEVYDGNQRLPIVGFEAVDLSVRQPGEFVTQVPVAARRHFLLLFDLVFADLKAVVKSREAGVRFVREQMQPSDVAAVALYSAGGARLLVNFTSDRRQLELAVETMGSPKLVQVAPDPLALMISSTAGAGETVGFGGASSDDVGRGNFRGDNTAAVLENLQTISRRNDEDTRRQSADQVTSLTRSLGELTRLLGSVGGRKYLVYFSEGFSGELLTGDATRDLAAQRDVAESGEDWKVASSDETFGNTRLTNDVEKMLEEFRRADFSVQAIDIAGLRAGGDVRPRNDGQASLLQMAKDTGGELFKDFNRLDEAMSQLMNKTSVVYVLTVQPGDLKANGKFHRLKLKLVGNQVAGAEVHARPGFYAPDAKRDGNPLLPQLAASEMILGGEEGGSLEASLFAAPFPMAGGRAYVPVLVEIDGSTLLEGAKGNKVLAELFVYAFDRDGRIAGYLSRNFGLDLEKVGKALRTSGIKYWGHLTLPPGQYSVRMLVRNQDTSRSRLTSTAVDVPDFAVGTELIAPLFPEAADKWLMIADQNRPQVDYPFLENQKPFVPAVHPLLPGRGQTPLQLVAFNLPAGATQGSATLTDHAGRTVQGAALEVAKRETAGKGQSRFAAILTTSGVPAGEYTLSVTLTAADGSSHQSSLPVAVGG